MTTFDVEHFMRQNLDDIWNHKQAGRLYDCAAATIAIHGPSGQELYGREDAIGEVIDWLAAFPDTRMEIEDLLWRGDEPRGFLVSIRSRRSGTNRGASIYGPGTGRTVSCSGIAHFQVQGGLIREIWQEWDEVGLVDQLGLDPDRALCWLDGRRSPQSAEPFGVGEIKRGLGQMPPVSGESTSHLFDAEDFVRRSLHDIWNRRLVGGIEQVYDEDLRWTWGDRDPGSRQDLIAHVLARLSAFPDLGHHVDQLILQGDQASGYRTSTLWTMLGTHKGPGLHGWPGGQRVRLQGITQHYIQAGRIVAEWTCSGELGLLQRTKPEQELPPKTPTNLTNQLLNQLPNQPTN